MEAISQHASAERREEASEMYLTSARRLAEALKTPRFYTEAKRAVEVVRKEGAGGQSS